MSTPLSPRLVRGALVGFDLLNPPPQLVVFQYNPDSLSRTLTPRTAAPGADRSDALRLHGPPEESIRLDVELDAAEKMQEGAGALGVHPALAALERLVYPGSAMVIANEVMLRMGLAEIVSPMAPMTFFVWGIKRILPVRISSFSINEEAFDSSLNPIRAKVSLGLQVLSYHDLGLVSVGGGIFLAHQLLKEAMAIVGMVEGIKNAAETAKISF